MKNKVSLACSVCGQRNYSTHKRRSTVRLEVRKYCKYCKVHTLHRETK